jgi:hypothetical protein
MRKQGSYTSASGAPWECLCAAWRATRASILCQWELPVPEYPNALPSAYQHMRQLIIHTHAAYANVHNKNAHAQVNNNHKHAYAGQLNSFTHLRALLVLPDRISNYIERKSVTYTEVSLRSANPREVRLDCYSKSCSSQELVFHIHHPFQSEGYIPIITTQFNSKPSK